MSLFSLGRSRDPNTSLSRSNRRRTSGTKARIGGPQKRRLTLEPLEQRRLLSTVTPGPEFQVNTMRSGAQEDPAIAMRDSGGFVAVWSRSYDGSSKGVSAQRYDSAGSPLDGEFWVNSHTADEQSTPDVAMDADGNFVVVWQSYAQDGSGYGVFGQRYDNAGTQLGDEFRLNSRTMSWQFQPSVAAAPDGDFAAVWTSGGQDGNGYGVYGQQYDSTGNPLGSEFRVSSYAPDDQSMPDVAMDADGNFVVVWQSETQDGSGYGVFGQRFDAGGVKLGDEFPLSSHTSGDQLAPSVAVAPNGDFVAVWASAGRDGDGSGISGQRYDSTGRPFGWEFRVNTENVGDQHSPSVTTDASGNFVVTWISEHSGWDVSGQRYNSFGIKLNEEFPISSYTADSEKRCPAIAADRDGDFVTVWASDGQDFDTFGVFGKRFEENDPPTAYAGGPYSGTEGWPISLCAANSSDPDDDTLQFRWDFDGDEVYDTTWSTDPAIDYSFDDDGSRTVTVQVFDGSAHDIAQTEVTVWNASPWVESLTTDSPVVAGDMVTVTISAADVAGDLPLTYEFDFNNDGEYEKHEVSSSDTVTASHVFVGEGVYPIKTRVSDGEGGEAIRWAAVQVGTTSDVTPPVEFVAPATLNVHEDAGTVTVEARLAYALPTHDVFVPLLLTGTAHDTEDYTLQGYILFPAGTTECALEVNVLDDALDEESEVLTIDLGAPVNATLGNEATYTVVIDDNDLPPSVSFTGLGQEVAEDAGLIEVSARLSVASGRDVVVPITFSGNATEFEDYTPLGTSVVIPSGFLIGSTSVSIHDDAIGEAGERISVEMHASDTVRLSPNPGDPLIHTIIVSRNDEPSASFLSTGKKVSEADGDVLGTVRLSNPSTETTIVPLSISADSTANLDDYHLNETELVFAPGEVERDVVISVINDDISATITPAPISMTRQYDAANPFDGLNVGERSTPTLGDLDGDGDLDLVAGSVDNGFDYFENTGTATSPYFVQRTGAQNPLDGFVVDDSEPEYPPYPAAVNNYSAPALGDWDGDGDLDLISGNDSGRGSTCFENVGSETTPLFVRLDDNPFRQYFAFDFVSSRGMSFGDVTADGVVDILVGGHAQSVSYYPDYVPAPNRKRFLGLWVYDGVVDAYRDSDMSYLGLQPLFSKPVLGDVDGDGDLDIVAGDISGGFQFFENSGSVTEPEFIERFGSNNPLSGQIVSAYSAPALGDLDGDGDLDLVVGDLQGGFSYFETTLEPGATPNPSEEQLNETVILEIPPSDGFQLGETTTFTVEIEDDDIPHCFESLRTGILQGLN